MSNDDPSATGQLDEASDADAVDPVDEPGAGETDPDSDRDPTLPGKRAATRGKAAGLEEGEDAYAALELERAATAPPIGDGGDAPAPVELTLRRPLGIGTAATLPPSVEPDATPAIATEPPTTTPVTTAETQTTTPVTAIEAPTPPPAPAIETPTPPPAAIEPPTPPPAIATEAAATLAAEPPRVPAAAEPVDAGPATATTSAATATADLATTTASAETSIATATSVAAETTAAVETVAATATTSAAETETVSATAPAALAETDATATGADAAPAPAPAPGPDPTPAPAPIPASDAEATPERVSSPRQARPRYPRRLKRFSFLRMLALLTVWGVATAAAGAYFVVSEIDKDLPTNLATVLDYRPNRTSTVFSADGESIGEFFLEKRSKIPLERIPPHVVNAFLAAEDSRFFKHPGFDIFGIGRAVWENFSRGTHAQGASTITQQVTRMLLLSTEKTYIRKMRELILAVRIERELSKLQILNIYLNHAYLGRGAYGVGAAGEIYFGKEVEQLSVAEAAMLAGLVQAPSRYAPHRNLPEARRRQVYVLERMVSEGFLHRSELAAALDEPLALVDAEQPLNLIAAPYFVEHIRRWATERFGHRDVFYGGMRIYTTLDTRMQHAAEAAVRGGLENLDRGLGFRGPVGHVDGAERTKYLDGPARPFRHGLESVGTTTQQGLLPEIPYVAVVTQVPKRRGDSVSGPLLIDLGPEEMRLADLDVPMVTTWVGADGRRLEVGDLLPVRLAAVDGKPTARLAQLPDLEGALIAMEPSTGRVLAMVGGYDYSSSQYNRATQAHRQIGSAIKPFIYATALAHGTSPIEIVHDGPISVATASGIWSPANYDNKFAGDVTLRTALAKSLNTVSVRLILGTGVDAVIETMRGLGVRSPIPRHVSIALGTPDLTLLEVAAGYAGFAAAGRQVEPRFVSFVTDGEGNILEDFRDRRPRKQVLTPDLAYTMTWLMKGAVERGTARKAQELGRPVAGKTGTSTGFRDVWFIGFTPDLLCGVWVGRDAFTPIGDKITGGGAALPIWLDFMKASHPPTPPRDFAMPAESLLVRANELSGRPGWPGDKSAVWVPFPRGGLPDSLTRTRADAPFADDNLPLLDELTPPPTVVPTAPPPR